MKASELRGKSEAELMNTLIEKRAELTGFERSVAANELPNPRVIANTRRDIARVLTVMNTPVTKTVERTEKGDAK
ncbi:MAG TPA: 50S ribosomal protein L29 [Candidatus Saccharimonadales bacterium]|jgi:ribosomal protein L29